jgi:acyl-CoA thioester hydrolase
VSEATPPGSVHRLAVRVYYEDTDAAGIVYHANYLRFAERGRGEMLRALGFGNRRLREETGIGFAVRRCTIDYLAPARLDDLLTVETAVVAASGATLAVRQTVDRGGRTLVRLDITVACIGADGRPRRLPVTLRAALAAAL